MGHVVLEAGSQSDEIAIAGTIMGSRCVASLRCFVETVVLRTGNRNRHSVSEGNSESMDDEFGDRSVELQEVKVVSGTLQGMW